MKSKKRLALVTGGGHGIGKAISLALGWSGMDITICGHNEKHLTSARDEILQTGAWVSIFKMDVTQPEEVQMLFGEHITKIGRLDVLVNNVGRVPRFGGFSDLGDEDWAEAWNLNFMGVVRMTRGALPWLKKSAMPSIVNIASVPARQPGMFNPHYSAAKAALANLGKYLANTLAADGILVNTICPGTLKGGGWERNVADRARRLGVTAMVAERGMEEEEAKKVPLGKIGTPEDVAEMVAFLASEKARFITGECIGVDGGVTRAIF